MITVLSITRAQDRVKTRERWSTEANVPSSHVSLEYNPRKDEIRNVGSIGTEGSMSVPMKLVYSSAPADDTFREQLSAHLYSLVQQGLLSEWHEQLIVAGAEVTQERHRVWLSADIILLLLSADYFSSNAYDDKEIRQALERHHSGQVIVVPILIRPCDWQATVVAQLQCLPRNGIPVALWENRDAALLTIVQELRHLITARQASVIPLTPVQRTNRQRLLKRVRTIWIEGLLEQSLQHAIWIDLHLQKQPDALE